MRQLRLGEFTLDCENRALCRGGTHIATEPKVIDCIEMLARAEGRVVPTARLVRGLWQGDSVAPEALRRVIRLARRALDDRGEAQQMIKTHRGRGYAYAGPRPVVPPVSLPATWRFRHRETSEIANAFAQEGPTGVLVLLSSRWASRQASVLGEVASYCGFAATPPLSLSFAPGRTSSPWEAVARGAGNIKTIEALGAEKDAGSVSRQFSAARALVDRIAGSVAATSLVYLVAQSIERAERFDLLVLDLLRSTLRDRLSAIACYRPDRVRLESPASDYLARTSGRDGVFDVHCREAVLATEPA